MAPALGGVVWAMVMAAAFGLNQVVARKGLLGLSVSVSTLVQLWLAAAFLVAAALLTGQAPVILAGDPMVLLIFAFTGFIHFFAGLSFVNRSLHEVGAARTGALIATTPIFAALFGFVFLGEALTLPFLVGMALVMVGVYVVSTR